MTWEEAIRWASGSLKARGMAANTIRNYRYDMLHIALRIGKEPTEISKMDLQAYILNSQEQNLSHETINRRLIALGTMFEHLQEMGMVSSNPAKTVRRLKTKKDRTHTYLSTDQIEQLEGMFRSYRYGQRHIFCAIMMNRMGLRVSEICGIDVSDFDLEHNMLSVRGKGNKTRALPIPSDLLPLILAHLAEREKKAKPGNASFFIGRSGRRLATRTVQHWFARAIAELYPAMKELPVKRRFTPHKLRHTFAVHSIKGGTDILTLQEILGHESVQTTQIYASADTGRIRAAMENHPLRR